MSKSSQYILGRWGQGGISLLVLTVKSHFDAAHRLCNYEGKCARIHGHTWQIEASVGGEKLDETGMLIDFSKLKKMLKKILEQFDHCYINETVEAFRTINPTAENLAQYIFNCLVEELEEENKDVKVLAVKVWESPEACAVYLPGETGVIGL